MFFFFVWVVFVKEVCNFVSELEFSDVEVCFVGDLILFSIFGILCIERKFIGWFFFVISLGLFVVILEWVSNRNFSFKILIFSIDCFIFIVELV